MLRDRQSECATVDRLVDAVRAGQSRVLVVRGEPGIGKSALLDYVARAAADCRVVRAAGVQTEMELAFAGLHQLCTSLLDRLQCLPAPQRLALGTAFGMREGDAPDRFLVGLAALSLLSDAAEDRPLVCLIDDAQWLDRASAQALAFVARRLLAESVAVVVATRAQRDDLGGLPELAVRGLPDGDARALLASVLRGPLDDRVRDRIIAETRGNPLALLELPNGVPPGQLAGGFGLPDAGGLPGRIEETFQRRLGALPVDTQRLLLVAAAEPVGDPVLLWRAARRLEIAVDAVTPAQESGLLELGAQVRFRHPLVRSAVYRSASPDARRAAHVALAEATDPEADPDLRAWHRAHGAAEPDEAVAADLERSAGRAQARGGVAAAAAFLERAAALTPDPGRRGERALAAAQAEHLAGAPGAALALLATAEAGRLDDLARARVQLLRAQVAFGSGTGSDAPTLLYDAARRLEPLDLDLARATYLEALCAAVYIGPLDSTCDSAEVARAALAAARSGPPRPLDLLLDGVALLITKGYASAAPALRRALSAFDSQDLSAVEGLGWGWLASYIASALWEHETQLALATRQVQMARAAGALTALPHTLAQLVGIHMRDGELAAAAALMHEIDTAVEATGSEPSLHLHLALAAYEGREADARALIEAGNERVRFRGGGIGVVVVQWASALLYNGLGRYEDALREATRPHEDAEPVARPPWPLPELIEAAVRTDAREQAADVFRRLSERAQVSGTDWALGLEARSRALLSHGEEAERLYRDAIERLAVPGSRVDLARAHLLYGEWLRRENRRTDAREQLRTAHEMLSEMGVRAFADRAARELLASGESAGVRGPEPAGNLTAQEAQIARLAASGLSNAEIGTRLFISPRTVEYHLRKVFAKLDISSRTQLPVS